MIQLLIMVGLALAKIKIFLVFHSHNDAGWLETAETYYLMSTRQILNTVLDVFNKDPEFKFSWAETFFLSRYLQEFPQKINQVKELIKAGRLEIVGGGWVQNDEAVADLDLVVRQMSLGFDYLRTELGVTQIKTGWQLDPFGHSSLTAELWEKMGFESLVFARVEKNIRVMTI